MNLLRFVLLVIAGWLGWAMLRRWLRDKIMFFSQSPHSSSSTPPLLMVRCAHCGIHFPQRDAWQNNHNWYCSRLHLEASCFTTPDGVK